MKRNADYWAERFKLIEQAEHNRGAAAVSDIEKQYREAQRQLEAKLDAWYRRFADNNQVSMTEAKKMLAGRDLKEFKWDVHEYIRYGEENALNGQWVKELENASARVHISRLEAMKIQMQQQVEVLFGGQLDSIDSAMRDIYLDGYYRTAYEVHKGVGFGWDFGTLDQRRIDKIINKPWAQDGRNFSDRVWSNKQKLVGELNTTLTQNIVLGQDPQKAIDVMAKRLNVSKNTAGRLVMTEQAAFCSAAQHDCFKDLDVEEYEIVATLDSHTSEICQEMDGKHFKMSEWETGITAPPFHVWCRSTTVPYFEDDFGEPGERAARGADGKTYMVPANTTYKEWSKAFVDGDKSGLQPVPQPAAQPSTGITGQQQAPTPTQTARQSDPVMKDLPDIQDIKDNGDVKAFAEKLIDNLGVDRTNISVNITGMTNNGQCVIANTATQHTVHYSAYELNANDQRDMAHRIRTAFHESFHLSAEGLDWDAVDSKWRIKESWRSLEETFTECSAHYMLDRYGVKELQCPSYAKKLVMNLPRLKQLQKYSGCDTIQDFGKIAFADRQSGVGATWIPLSKKMKAVKITPAYYAQYYQYINDHEDELFDMLFGNMPGYQSYRSQMKTELQSAMQHHQQLGFVTNSNEEVVYYNILACAMQKVGIK